MFRQLFSKTNKRETKTAGMRGSLGKGAKQRHRLKSPQVKGINNSFGSLLDEEPFPDKDASNCTDILIRGSSFLSYEVQNVFDTLAKDENASITESVSIHGEIRTKTATLPGYRIVDVSPKVHFSRMLNFEADAWRYRAVQRADAYMYLVEIKNVDEYLSKKSGWESDRDEISRLLRNALLIENPKKPLLLLVNCQDSDQGTEDFDTGRLIHLWGLERLERPFRVSLYSDIMLKEALEWTAAKVRSATVVADDEATAATECETEEENSIITTNTAFSSADAYVLDYEPTLPGGNATLQRFKPIKNGTHCPFARAANLWGGKLADETVPVLRRSSAVSDAAILNAGPLAEFVTRVSEGEPLDGFCLEVPGGGWLDLEAFGEEVRELLTKLAELDPTPGENAMKRMGPVDSPRWRFRFADEDFFLTTFSPAYGKDSSRYAFETRRAFILFQPMTSFGRRGLTHDTPASSTQWKNPTSMRDRARVAFKKAGCPYHIPEELPYPAAEHVVKPKRDDGKNIIRWWEPNDREHSDESSIEDFFSGRDD